MKCPKCGYLGFEPVERCRHCGYDFSLLDVSAPAPTAATARSVDGMRTQPHREPARGSADGLRLTSEPGAPLDLPLSTSPPAPSAAAALTATLFAEPQQPPPARTPLAVRRTADRPRARTTPHVVRRPRQELLAPQADVAIDAADVDAGPLVATAAARLASASIDIALLAAIDVAVVYLTAQMAGVPVAEAATLPLPPLVAFVFGLNVAYLAVFTASGGQTLGKMALGLRVESTEGALTFGGAVVRVAATIVGGLVLGAGFVPALWRADRRAVHDHLAHTRVIKVPA